MVVRNELADPSLIIARLKREVADLKSEIVLLKGGEGKDSLDQGDIERCRREVNNFIESSDPSATIIMADKLLINQCFYEMKHMYREMAKKGGGGGGAPAIEMGPNNGNVASPQVESLQSEIQRMQMLI